MPAGRPSEFTPEIGDAICDALIEGESLRSFCGKAGNPAMSTVMKWLSSGKHPAFVEQYARAREMAADTDADDIAHYARKAAEGKIEPAAATAAINGLKWSAGKRAPKKYGDKLALTGGGADDPPIRHQVDLSNLTDEELSALEAIRSKLAIPGGDQGGEGEAEG